MCDAFSMFSAIGSVGGGIANSIDAKSRASFEAAQMEALGFLAAAQAADDTALLRKSFRDQVSANVAAMAVTGLDPVSFEAVMRGNRKNLAENEAALQANADRQRQGLGRQARVTRMEGGLEASLSLFNGFLAAGNTLIRAEQSYRENNTGQTRGEYFRDSLGTSFFARKGES